MLNLLNIKLVLYLCNVFGFIFGLDVLKSKVGRRRDRKRYRIECTVRIIYMYISI